MTSAARPAEESECGRTFFSSSVASFHLAPRSLPISPVGKRVRQPSIPANSTAEPHGDPAGREREREDAPNVTSGFSSLTSARLSCEKCM